MFKKTQDDLKKVVEFKTEMKDNIDCIQAEINSIKTNIDSIKTDVDSFHKRMDRFETFIQTTLQTILQTTLQTTVRIALQTAMDNTIPQRFNELESTVSQKVGHLETLAQTIFNLNVLGFVIKQKHKEQKK